MDRYLTDRARAKRIWEIPAGAFSLMLGTISVQVWLEDAPADEGMLIWLLAHACVTAVMFLPLYRILRFHLRQRRARRIAARLAACSERIIPLSELDRVLGMAHAARKIEALKRGGFLQRIESDGMNLVLDGAEAPAPAAEPEPEAEPEDVIAQIRHLNDEIDDEAVSQRIERIEGATAGILETIEAHPERAEAARRFMNYYLPATLKLLETYRLMEKQSYQGENIHGAREKIEAVLDKLVVAAERQQDMLFGAEAMDVEAEIEVLETMMSSDGLI